MKKYYATEVDNEYFDYDAYLDDDILEYAGIAVYGNNEYIKMNADLVESIIHALDDCKYDLDTVRDDLADGEISEDSFEEEVIKTVDNYFNNNLSKEAKFELVRLCDQYAHCTSREEESIVVKAMSINYEKQYKVREIHGCCQGDYTDVYYPVGTTEDFLQYLEAVYFGTGTEFEITEEKVESDEVDYAETYFDYTYLYRAEDIKKWLAKNLHCTEDEVVVRTIKNRHTHYTYEYEEN